MRSSGGADARNSKTEGGWLVCDTCELTAVCSGANEDSSYEGGARVCTGLDELDGSAISDADEFVMLLLLVGTAVCTCMAVGDMDEEEEAGAGAGGLFDFLSRNALDADGDTVGAPVSVEAAALVDELDGCVDGAGDEL